MCPCPSTSSSSTGTQRGAGHAIAAICGVHPLKGTANLAKAALASGATTLDGTPKETALHCREENMLKYVSVVARIQEKS